MLGIPTPDSPAQQPATLTELADAIAARPGGRRSGIAELAETLARRLGHTLIGAGFALIDECDPAGNSAIADGLICPSTLGQVYELLLGDTERRTEGAHYTPPSLAAGLVGAALTEWESSADTAVLDPSSGGGAFLLAAGAALAERHNVRRTVIAARLQARDIDPLAVAVAELSIALWCAEGGETPRPFGTCLVADSLRDPLPPSDLIVGNPPFLNQLAKSTARSGAANKAVRERFGTLAGPYADTAAYFMLAAGKALLRGGRMVLIQPQSILSSRDVIEIRRWSSETLHLSGFWYCAEPVFAASVRVCAPFVDRTDERSTEVRRWAGPDVTPAPLMSAPDPDSWGPLVADLIGIPTVVRAGSGSAGTLDSLATTTAGFRDQFYGFAPHTTETTAEPTSVFPAAITVGMVDALRLRWGTDSFRYAGTRWQRPVVDLQAVAAVDPSLHGWATDRLRPKVLLATQTKVIEVVVDTAGTLLPITPVISIEPIGEPGDESVLWKIAAAMSAPRLSAWALTRRLGSALSVQALKLAARDVGQFELPTDHDAWDAGADLARRAHHAESADQWTQLMSEFGEVMGRAYGPVDPALISWWWERLPAWR